MVQGREVSRLTGTNNVPTSQFTYWVPNATAPAGDDTSKSYKVLSATCPNTVLLIHVLSGVCNDDFSRHKAARSHFLNLALERLDLCAAPQIMQMLALSKYSVWLHANLSDQVLASGRFAGSQFLCKHTTCPCWSGVVEIQHRSASLTWSSICLGIQFFWVSMEVRFELPGQKLYLLQSG